MESLKKNQSDLYYSDSAIRERCYKMICDYRMAEVKARPSEYYTIGLIDHAEILFQYIKTGVSLPDEDRTGVY